LTLQIVVKNGVLSEAEQDIYVRRITDKFPVGMVDRIVLEVHDEYVDAQYTLHQFRELRKMSGYCIGNPEDWNEAKRAELRDTIPNWIDP